MKGVLLIVLLLGSFLFMLFYLSKDIIGEGLLVNLGEGYFI